MDQIPNPPILKATNRFFIILPWVLFLMALGIGGYIYNTQNQQIESLNNNVALYQKHIESLHANKPAQKNLPNIVALSIASVSLNETFTIKSLPRDSFNIGKVYKASGEVANISQIDCANGVTENVGIIGVRLLDGDERLWCMDNKVLSAYSGIANPSMFIVELKFDNNSANAEPMSNDNSKIKAFYVDKSSGKLKLAYSWTSTILTVKPLSSISVRQSLLIPYDVNSVYLVYGDFSASNQFGTEFFKIPEAGFKIDFDTKTYNKLSSVDVNNLLFQYRF